MFTETFDPALKKLITGNHEVASYIYIYVVQFFYTTAN